MKKKTITDLHGICRLDKQAPAVYLALCEISREKKRDGFRVSRKEIRAYCGVPEQRISRILTFLELSNWIGRKFMRNGFKKFLFIKLLKQV
jgi:hypothetical protein